MEVSAQVQAAQTRALVVPSPSLGVLVVTGKDRQTWLNGLVTCDLAKLAPGDAVYGLAVAQKGRILSDLVFVADPSRVLVVAPRAELEGLRAAFDKYLIMEDAEMGESVDGFAVYFVHGPGARAALDAACAAGGVGGALDVTGLGGAVVLAPREADAKVRAALDAHGAIGDDAGWDALRVERGVPRFGVDFDATMYPQEASLEKRAVSFDKGCYLGQEVVCMLEMRGHVKRKLVPLVLSEGDVPARGASVTTEAGEAVGEVTSAARSASLGVPVVIAMVKYAHAKGDAPLRVGAATAKIVG